MDTIGQIVMEAWNSEKEYDPGMKDMYIMVSYILEYGYGTDDVIAFAEMYEIGYDSEDCDLEDDYEGFGALKITEEIIDQIRQEEEE